MKIAIMQPTFNPWIGHFDLIDYVDEFIFFDTVQFTKRDWQTRNKFKIQNKEFMFTIPVKKTAHRNDLLIKDAVISFEHYDFRQKLLQLLTLHYKKAPFFTMVHPVIEELIMYQTDSLSSYNIHLISNIAKLIGIDTTITILSKTSFHSDKKKGELILDICQYFHTNKYISPLGAKEYLEPLLPIFQEKNIEVYFQNYVHPLYQQIGEGFISHLGIIDLLYNQGFHHALPIIQSGRAYFKSSKKKSSNVDI